MEESCDVTGSGPFSSVCIALASCLPNSTLRGKGYFVMVADWVELV